MVALLFIVSVQTSVDSIKQERWNDVSSQSGCKSGWLPLSMWPCGELGQGEKLEKCE